MLNDRAHNQRAERARVGEVLHGRDKGLVGKIGVLGLGDIGLAAAVTGQAGVDGLEILAFELVVDR